MANKKLGIDVEIKYPTANQIRESINKEWQSVKGDFDIKVNVAPDGNSMRSFRKRIKDFLKDEDFEFKLRLDTVKALSDLQEIRREFRAFKSEADEGVSFKLTGIKEESKNLKDVSKNVQNTSKTQEKSDVDRMARLREIMSLQREMNSLQTRKVSASAQEQEVYNKRIEELGTQLQSAKNEYKELFNTSADDEWMLQNVKRAGEFNVELREVKETQRETNEMFKQYTGLLNEEFGIQKNLQTAGEGQSRVLEEQLSKIRLKRGELLQTHDLENRMSDSQKQVVTEMIRQNDYQQKLTQAKREDKELADRQNATYKELKSDMNEIHKIQMKITDLQAKHDAGVATAKEEDTLNSLKMQLVVREDLNKTSKDIADSEGLITKEAEESLDALRQQQTEKQLIAEGTAKINADLKVTNNLYDDLMSSVKRVQSLTKEMSSAGSSEAEVIRKTIRAEEDKQAEIRETLKEQNRVNDAREEEYATMKRLNNKQEQISSERSSARESDKYRENSIIGMLDPRTVYNEGKRAAMAVYNVVAELDTQIVDIEKVADASEAEMSRFKENVFDFASDVGKSADEYAESVERWVTQGFTLAEGMELARESTMGAFVGNIDEADMVDYMSVPLASYKDTVLETSDILNVMNEVANNNAVEMDILGESYKRAAQTASNSGTSFSELTGLITGAQEATRFGGEVIGTSLRTMDLNFSKMGAKLTKSDITKNAFFKDIGIDINDANGELRSTYDIIEDLEEVWGSLSSKERSTASIYAGGSRHAVVLQGIIKGWDKVKKATGEAEEQMGLIDKKSGSAYKEFEVQMNSVEYATAGLKNAWAELLHQIAGRDEIINVVNQLKDLVEVGVELTQNEGFMRFAKTFLKAALWTTASIAIGKVFNVFKMGMTDTFGLAKGGVEVFASLFGKTEALSSLFPKLSGVVGGFGGVIGKLVPVLGLAYGAIALLDIAGVDVIGTFKSMMDGTFSLNSAIKEYEEVNKRTSKSIKENPLINNEFDDVNDLLKKYRKLNEEKEKKARASEEEVIIRYSDDEYKQLRDEFNAQTEDLDIDLKIQFNDYDHIKSQLEELQKQKETLEAQSAQELIGDIKERNKLPSNRDSYDDDYEKKIKDKQLLLNAAIGQGDRELIAQRQKALDEFSRTSKEFTDEIYSSADFKKSKEAREEMIVDARQTRDELVKIHKDLEPSKLGREDSLWTAQELLPSLSQMQNEINTIKSLNKELDDNGTLSKEHRELIKKLAPEYGELPPQISAWEDAEKKAVQEAIDGQRELNKETSESVEERIRALMKYSNEFTDDEINEYMNKIKGTHQEMIQVMSELGVTGELALGVSEEALVKFGDKWSDVMIEMQDGVDKLPSDKVLEYQLVTDDGLFNWDIFDAITKMPEEVITKYDLLDNNGVPKLENLIELFDKIPEDKLTDYDLKGEDGILSIEKLLDVLDEIPEEEIIEVLTNTTNFTSGINEVERVMGKERDINVEVRASAGKYFETSELVDEDIVITGKKEANPMFKGDSEEFEVVVEDVMSKLTSTGNSSAVPDIDADKSAFDEKNQEVINEINKPRSMWVDIRARVIDSFDKVNDMTNGWLGKGLGYGRSVGINPEPNIGGALSRGVSQSVGTSASSTSSSKGNPRYNTPAKVDTDVWRYWSKELFKGIPLENSMEKLNRSIQNASEDNNKLISLYKEQNKIIKQQISYEKDMKKAQQSEMNYILSQLRKEGFKTSGNKVTNLGISKNMKGEKAERSSELLSQYKSLYQTMNTTNDRINQLNQDILNNNKTIKDTQKAEKERILQEAIEKETKALEKVIKRAEGLLTNVTNDMNIFATKLGLISDLDYELKLSVSEEGINKASKNIKGLVDEFNRLSKTSIKYEDNIDGVQTELESLKNEIISNADSILAYRDALKEIEVQRMINDFDKFSSAIENNLAKISNNIDNLRDGLVSGQSLSDLASSSLMGIDFNRKSKIEREYEQRLELERELNEALDAFAKKNVDRVKNVANATLTVEKSKYEELLKLAKGYSNGKVEGVTISKPSQSIGATTSDTSKDKNYQLWLDDLAKINNDYAKAYDAMVKKYDDAMKKATSASEKELITNAMIIEQLKLQEGIYRKMMESNNVAIKNTEEMLKDSGLTTEQREQLLDAIEEYKQSNMEAQNSVKDSIQSRFDLEFELIDEAIERAGKYTEAISDMVDIAQAVGSGNDVMSELYKSIYESKINEYAKATEIIEELAKQQSKFEEGSFEWNILQEKIMETEDSLSGLTLDILNANKDILSSQLDIIQEYSEKLTLGTSANKYDKYQKTWMDGVEKELELEKLRVKLAGIEDKTLQGKLELMDRQEKVSRAELEYIDKQLEAVRLQEKLDNIRDERNIKTLIKDSDGNWQWDYVADQSEYDSTKEELDDLRLEIEKYREEQRREYVNEMNDIITKVKDGEFDSIAELEEAIADVNDSFKDILKDITDISLYDTASIIKAYEDYLKNNDDVISNISGDKTFSDKMAEVGKTFENSFLNVATDFGIVIAEELKKALNTTAKSDGDKIIIEKQVLEFPNITDSNGLKEAIEELPQLAKQVSSKK